MKTFKEWFESLDKPDNIGTSEYRAIYEILENIGKEDSEADAEDFELAEEVLNEFVGWSNKLRDSLQNIMYRIEE